MGSCSRVCAKVCLIPFTFGLLWKFVFSFFWRFFRLCGCCCISSSHAKDTKEKQKLVILGSGWGAYSTLSKLNTALYDVTIISKQSDFSFTPLLCQVAGGYANIQSVSSAMLSNDKRFIHGEAKNIDFANLTVECLDYREGSTSTIR